MKKYVLSLSLIIVFAFYVLLENQSSTSVVSNTLEGSHNTGFVPGANTPSAAPTAPPSVSATTTSGASLPAAAPLATVAAGLYRDGSYTGDSVNAYFGNVQVEAVVSGENLPT